MCIKVEIKELSEVLTALRELSERMDKFIEIFGDVESNGPGAAAPITPAPETPAPAPETSSIAPEKAPIAPVYAQNTPPAPAAVPVATASPAAAPLPTVPTAAQTYTQDQLALAASGLIDAGKLVELQQLLAAFNVDSLARLPAAQYGAFATKLREMGAKI